MNFMDLLIYPNVQSRYGSETPQSRQMWLEPANKKSSATVAEKKFDNLMSPVTILAFLGFQNSFRDHRR